MARRFDRGRYPAITPLLSFDCCWAEWGISVRSARSPAPESRRSGICPVTRQPMLFQRNYIEPPDPSSRFRRWGLAASVVGLIVIAGVTLARQHLPGWIQTGCREKLVAALEDSGLEPTIRDIEFREGEGFEIKDFELRQPGAATPLLEAYSVHVEMPVSLNELVSGDPQAQGLRFNGGRLTLQCDENGQWNVGSLVTSLQELSTGGQPIPVSVHNYALRIIDHRHSPPLEFILSDVALDIRPMDYQGRRLLEVTGGFAGLKISDVQFSGFFEPETGGWFADVEAKSFQLTTDVLTLVPQEIRDVGNELVNLSGQLDLQGRAEGVINAPEATRFEIKAGLRNFAINDKRLPLALSGTDVDLVVSDRHVQVTRASGFAGDGRFDISYWQNGLLERGDWQFNGNVTNLDFNPQLESWLPGSCRKFCEDFSPHGRSDIHFQLASTSGVMHRNIRADMHNMSFNYVKFPFETSGCRGIVTWIGDECDFDFTGMEKDVPIRFTGQVHRPGPSSTFDINVDVEGALPVDYKLLTAASRWPNLRQAVNDFQPTGRISCNARFTKTRSDSPDISRAIDVRLHHWNVRHRAFPYDIQNVGGLVRIRNEVTTFEEITGSSGLASVRCDGTWSKPDGIDLTFFCRDIPLDENLRSAVSDKIRNIWDGFRPRGTVDFLRVDLTTPPGGRTELVVNVDLTEPEYHTGGVTIFPTWFPYELTGLIGKIAIGEGRIELVDFRANHGRSYFACQGQGNYNDDNWALSLQDLLVGSLRVDRDLIRALPEELGGAVSQLEFDGLLNVAGEMTFGGETGTETAVAGVATRHPEVARVSYYEAVNTPPGSATGPIASMAAREPGRTRMNWNLRFDMNQANLVVGVPIENVFGMVQLIGSHDGRQTFCHGELAIDSLMLYGAQVTGLTGPIRIDRDGVYAGAMASDGAISPDARRINGTIFDGMLVIDGRRSSNGTGAFLVNASLSGGDLKEFVNEYAPQMKQINGSSYAVMRLEGDSSGPLSYRGAGHVSLRNAEIYELPVMLSLLKILNVKEVNRTAFDTGNFEFSINGDSLDFQRMELIGNAVSLIGEGHLNFDGGIDLNFYSVMGRGRWYIPVLSELYKAGSQRTLWINAHGTLENPQTDRHILPQLNDSIRNLLEGRPILENSSGFEPGYLTEPLINAGQPPRIDANTMPVGSSYFDR
ncbi:MAG: AsmA-like C-terminal region-containing protein [Planctomycetota bacterium]